MAQKLRRSTDDLPILACDAGETDGGAGHLHAAFGVDVGSGLFGVGGAREDDIRKLGAHVAVVPLVDDESVGGDVGGGDFVGAEEPDDFRGDLGLGGGGGNKADVIGSDTGSSLGKGSINREKVIVGGRNSHAGGRCNRSNPDD